MHLLNEETINELPIHDSDLLKLSISQNYNGAAELRLSIGFYKDEIDLLTKPLKSLLTDGNQADILFRNCYWVNMEAFFNITRRDEFDYMEYLRNTPQLKHYAAGLAKNHMRIKFISGSTLECIFEEVAIVQCNR
ncbi:MAG: hypothetical protein JW944_14940 [Deltaproteobacteria bacterium]|nr:hypothetical protein [Deltaproteobacteria bacterium]